MSIQKIAGAVAYGVEEGHAPYSLRQSRYDALAADVAALAQQRYETLGERTAMLDVGVYNGVSRRYLEQRPGAEHLDYSGVDIFPKGEDFVYKSSDWRLYHADLNDGMHQVPDASYDVVVCEQVLEHLTHPENALRCIERVLKPKGLAIIGVPIFPPGIHWIRKHVVPVADQMTGTLRGHVQAWCLASFQHLVSETCESLSIDAARGFRIVSGGPLRFLEYHQWWWRLNRWMGEVVPGLCTEVQILATRKAA